MKMRVYRKVLYADKYQHQISVFCSTLLKHVIQPRFVNVLVREPSRHCWPIKADAVKRRGSAGNFEEFPIS